MGGRSDTRAVSEVMGAILVFSLLVTALGAYQAVIVPNQNEQVEFRHSNEVQQDLLDLRNSIHQSSTSGEDTSVAVDLGVNYPVRALTLNPPEQGGTLQGVTTGPTGSGPTDLAVENATAIDGEVNDYWNNSTREFTTGRVVYAPSYSIYRNAPATVIENGIIYNRFGTDEPDIPLSGQRVVSGRQISLVAIESDLATSQVEATALDVDAVSAGSTEIAITNASNGDNVTIRIPTNLSEDVWVGQLLNDQIDGADPGDTACTDINTAGDNPDRYIHNCTYTENSEFNVLALEMERNTTYTLKLSKVAVGKTAPQPGPHYMVALEGENVSVPEQGKQQLVLQVRDKFNNPVSGTTVNLSLDPSSQGTLVHDGKSSDSFSNLRTNEEGKIIASYHAPSEIASSPVLVDVEASYSVTPSGSLNESTRQNTTFDMRVINATKINRTQPLLNPSEGIAIVGSSTDDAGCSGGAGECKIKISFKNLGSGSKEITAIRYSFFSGDSQGNAFATNSGELQWEDPSLGASKDLEQKGNFVGLGSDSIEVDSSGETVTFRVVDENGDDIGVTEGDFFVIEIIEDGEVRRAFFFSPEI